MQRSPQTLADVELNPYTGFFPVFDGNAPVVAQGILAQYAWAGVHLPSAQQAREGAANGSWGIGAASRDMDATDKLSEPFAAVERIRPFDVQRCVEIAPGQINLDPGVLFELVHVSIPSGSIAILEDIPTIFDDVTAVDQVGTELFTYGNLNGLRPCLNELVHPDPTVTEPLRWRFHFTYHNQPYLGAEVFNYLGPILPIQMSGRAILPAWNDMRFGINNRWASEKQCQAPASSIVRMWVEFTGPVDRFRVRVGARLGGFYQFGGRQGAALTNALIRHT